MTVALALSAFCMFGIALLVGLAAISYRHDGHVAWVGDGTDRGLHDALTKWFGPR